jgi:hypothetical protein
MSDHKDGFTIALPTADECHGGVMFQGGHGYNFHEYMSALNDFEYNTEIGDYTVYVSKVGGGTAGSRYSGSWYYAVVAKPGLFLPAMSRLVSHGDDFSTSSATSHRSAAHQIFDMIIGDE